MWNFSSKPAVAFQTDARTHIQFNQGDHLWSVTISLKSKPPPGSRSWPGRTSAWSNRSAMSGIMCPTTAGRWRKSALRPMTSRVWTTSTSSPSSPRTICATPIPTACWPSPWPTACASSPPPAPPGAGWLPSTPSTIWTSGRTAAPGPSWPRAAPATTCATSATATASLPAAPASTAAATRWGA